MAILKKVAITIWPMFLDTGASQENFVIVIIMPMVDPRILWKCYFSQRIKRKVDENGGR